MEKGGKVCAYFPSAASLQPLGKMLDFGTKINDNALVAHQSNLFPLHSVLMVEKGGGRQDMRACNAL